MRFSSASPSRRSAGRTRERQTGTRIVMFPRKGGGLGPKQGRRSWPLDPRLRGGTGRGAPPPPPPRRRPGSSWGTLLTKRSTRLLQPPQLDPGLRRGGIRYGARLVREMTATPASAGERVGGQSPTIITTPAKAGVQLGDGANGAQHPVTATSPTGPRPSPGWCQESVAVDLLDHRDPGLLQGPLGSLAALLFSTTPRTRCSAR